MTTNPSQKARTPSKRKSLLCECMDAVSSWGLGNLTPQQLQDRLEDVLDKAYAAGSSRRTDWEDAS